MPRRSFTTVGALLGGFLLTKVMVSPVLDTVVAAELLDRRNLGGTAQASLSVNRESNAQVSKTIFSSKFRLMNYVGLEGAGHHYIDDTITNMFAAHESKDEDDLLHIPYPISTGAYYLVTAMSGTAAHYAEKYQAAGEEMRKLALRGDSLKPPGTLAQVSGRYSYPFDKGPDKVLQYIDMRMMAEVAETQGVDFRVLYLRRSVKDMVIANTVHRDFQNGLGDEGVTPPEERFMDYMRILFTDIAVMHSLLAEIDPAFVVCHDFEFLGDAGQAAKIADFLAPNSQVAEVLQFSLMDTAVEDERVKESLPFLDSEMLISRLQHKFDAFESTYCH